MSSLRPHNEEAAATAAPPQASCRPSCALPVQTRGMMRSRGSERACCCVYRVELEQEEDGREGSNSTRPPSRKEADKDFRAVAPTGPCSALAPSSVIVPDQRSSIRKRTRAITSVRNIGVLANSTSRPSAVALFAAIVCLSVTHSNSQAPCTVCPGGEAITLPEQALDFGESFAMLDTCGALDQASFLIADDSFECSLIHSVSSLCGCPVRADACSLCPGGASVSLPGEDLSWLLGDSASSMFGSSTEEGAVAGSVADDIVPTCGLVEAIATSYAADSNECRHVQSTAGLCGCPSTLLPGEASCVFCPNDATGVADPDKPLEMLESAFGAVPTCGQLERILTQVSANDPLCQAQEINYLCGCNNGQRTYFGATTETQKRVLVWVPRASAMLSVLGSFFILWSILRDTSKRKSMYGTLMIALSGFDILGAFVWMLTTLPVPVYDEFGEPTGIYGAHGNDQTCTAQGFFVQLGLTSIFYNISLSFYYLLVIRYSMKEAQLQKYHWVMLGFPAGVGLVLACVGIPFYENTYWGCYIGPPPIQETWVPIVMFAIVPICLTVAITALNTLLVYLAVRAQAAKANKWLAGRSHEIMIGSTGDGDISSVLSSRLPRLRNAPGSASSVQGEGQARSAIDKMERASFWQAVAYVGALCLSWPILVANLLTDWAVESFAFMLAALMLAPLQGFFNFLVFVRPRVQCWYEDRQQSRRLKQQCQDIPEQSKRTHRTKSSSPSIHAPPGEIVLSCSDGDMKNEDEETKAEDC